MIGSKPENSRCEPAQLDKEKKCTLLPTFVLRLPRGYPSDWGDLAYEHPKPSGTFTCIRTLGVLFKVKESND